MTMTREARGQSSVCTRSTRGAFAHAYITLGEELLLRRCVPSDPHHGGHSRYPLCLSCSSSRCIRDQMDLGSCERVFDDTLHWLTKPALSLQLRTIPAVGGTSAPILSYLTARDFNRNGKQHLIEGYRRVRTRPLSLNDLHSRCSQFYGGVFKVAFFDRWLVVISGRKLIEDLRKRPDDEVSFTEAIEDVRVPLWCYRTL